MDTAVKPSRLTSRFKALLAAKRAVILPGAPNALFARVIEDLGFEAVYVTGAGIANMQLGAPDVGLVTLTEVATIVAAICGCGRRCRSSSMPIRASAIPSTWSARCACSSARAPPASRSKTRSSRRNAATSRART